MAIRHAEPVSPALVERVAAEERAAERPIDAYAIAAGVLDSARHAKVPIRSVDAVFVSRVDQARKLVDQSRQRDARREGEQETKSRRYAKAIAEVFRLAVEQRLGPADVGALLTYLRGHGFPSLDPELPRLLASWGSQWPEGAGS